MNFTVTEYELPFDGQSRDDVYNVTMQTSPPRSFLGLKKDVAWDFRPEVCYYVGNVQGGVIAEDLSGGPVIEGDYTEYIMDSLFSTEFRYSRFREELCETIP